MPELTPETAANFLVYWQMSANIFFLEQSWERGALVKQDLEAWFSSQLKMKLLVNARWIYGLYTNGYLLVKNHEHLISAMLQSAYEEHELALVKILIL